MKNSNQKARKSEELAAAQLKKRGYKLLAMNWQESGVEVDLVVKRRRRVYLVEVKYRQRDTGGGGFIAIDTQKLRRLARAAEYWQINSAKASEIGLLAVAVGGEGYEDIMITEVTL